MVGQAAVARRLGDLARVRALLDAAASHYQHVNLPAGPAPRARRGGLVGARRRAPGRRRRVRR
jgi:hypothetical protein